MNDLDLKFLETLMRLNFSVGRASNALGLPRSTVFQRLLKLKESGVISEGSVKINWDKLGFKTKAILRITANGREKLIEEKLSELPNALHICRSAGQYDFYLRIVTKDAAEAQRIVQLVRNIEGVTRVDMDIVLKTIHPAKGKLELLHSLAEMENETEIQD